MKTENKIAAAKLPPQNRHVWSFVDVVEHPIGNCRGAQLEKIGAPARKHFVNRRVENLQPAIEMPKLKRRFQMQLAMNLQRIAPVLLIIFRAEEQSFPKIADNRQVTFQIEFGNVGKNVADHIVGNGSGVKRPHQPVNIRSVFNILHCGFR